MPRSSVAAVFPPSVSAPVKLDRRTKDLVKRLAAGDIAVIAHRDVDVVAAETLINAAPSVVVNAEPFSSGRYPNQGPLLLLDAGIQLVDRVGLEIFDKLAEGDACSVVGGEVYHDGDVVARGVQVDREHILETHKAAESRLSEEFQLFVTNTVEYLDQDRGLLGDELDLPTIDTHIDGRHVLIVVRGASYKDDLKMLKGIGYLSEQNPVLIGVDGGADALMDMGFKPDIIIGDFDSVTDATLRCGADLIVHAYRDGRAPGAARLDSLGLSYHKWATGGTSEDIAMLLAYDCGAELIVAVGTHSSMVEFLEKGRAGMASTVLVRMKVGTRLVDAKGVSRLYHHGVKARDLLIMVAAAVFALAVVMMVSAPIRLIIRTIWVNLTNLVVAGLGP